MALGDGPDVSWFCLDVAAGDAGVDAAGVTETVVVERRAATVLAFWIGDTSVTVVLHISYGQNCKTLWIIAGAKSEDTLVEPR